MRRIINPLLCAVISGWLFVNGMQAQTLKNSTAIVDHEVAEKWRADLRYFAQEMPKRHKDLYHLMTREQFESAVKSLDARIPALTREQIIIELDRIVAMVGDGHTRIQGFPFDPKIGFRSYPISLYLYKDGLFVQAAEPKHREIVGARVVKIGDASAEQGLNAVRDLVCRDGDNDMSIKAFAPVLLVTAEVLRAVGLVSDIENARFTVERDGRQETVILKPTVEHFTSNHGPSVTRPANWIDARDAASAPTPLWLKDPQNYFWFEYLPDTRSVYVQYNTVANKDSETVADFAKRLFSFVDAHPVDRFILDVRLNGGGNNYLNRPLLLGIIKSKIDQRGKLFTIIGRETFSAAQSFVDELEKYTNTIFVGEPTGESVNQFGDPAHIDLPNSGITVRASTLWWQFMDPRDTRKWTAPQIAADLTSVDYRDNVDPAMNAILRFVPKKDLSEQLRDALAAKDAVLVVSRYRAFKSDPENEYVSTERILNNLGYELLGKKRFDEAIEILKLNVESYPKSSNAYDSLGEAYMMSGNKELAIRNYEKALELNPANAGALEALKKLQGK